MQDFAQPQLQPYTHPCIIELPGGYRVYGQDRDRLNEGLSVLLENGIQFPSPNLVQHYAEPPPRYLVPADSSSSSSISTQTVTATPATVAKSEEAFKPFGYYRDLYLLRQDRRNINDETYASDAFITELAQDNRLRGLMPTDSRWSS
ncbi:hypothetical protein [Dyella sp. RRB7]|uniref:hypothetical protein n=1 Tax=Dyella sp. RRB7 TaxID=2919502 RepID=UPI001FAB1B28|nr:hypothetical protein [Dyella sp. RRB7]